ncbi:MAG: phosphohydrolase [Candidatus Schekmanbacteria bacterium RIFCSPHIGHO2_02_FULL_38_11]|uniref:Phosphohydrolase n=1 Tax=Candidatus Schekmanbacteria bacterium RIFCSPLOWO2_12_FULL_38_15 TaxID=1817883 RepID=A0A1F7SH85_9BACT|nr:MAG: phosphohydrolase [Candidatus Schekmanbacteria bacterium GWA2_38_9]OGL49737.1 MAG: phosphohydrolase [Candidatus Schekmanbacteria bacterium RIFCSPLOWO2_02_FULL_38_14]OGL53091.1 MAG: phosphohydrolase [Candidatus Schekmanbacteria bacterium RIFCSPLOWO2_12_FULL_38_15]OGL53793.1 MAG: phosphohydrolase [Candidatus Schekmanbacteria bacterium RIFCSPHIGHO2_02_FULL_38_11]
MLKKESLKEMENYFGSDTRRISHARKVTNFALDILDAENLDNPFFSKTVTLSGVFHDIGIHEAERKYNSNSGKYQEIEGPPIARGILEKMNIEKDVIDRVCYIIGGHHTESKIDNIDFKIIWDADLIVNIEEDNICADKEKVSKIITKSFKTESGKKLAEKLYLKLKF